MAIARASPCHFWTATPAHDGSAAHGHVPVDILLSGGETASILRGIMPEQSALDRTLDVLEAERVPKFTQAVADAATGSAGLDDLVSELVDWLGPINVAVREHPEDLTPLSSSRASELIEWAMTCLEKHCESVGLPADMPFVLLPIADELLVRLSNRAPQ